MIILSIFARVASIFIKAGIWLFAMTHHIWVWFDTVPTVVTVVTVDTVPAVVRLHAIVIVPVGVTRISARLPSTDASAQSLDTYSNISSSLAFTDDNGEKLILIN